MKVSEANAWIALASFCLALGAVVVVGIWAVVVLW